MANEDAGQEFFNAAWFIIKGTYSPTNNSNTPFLSSSNFDFLLGNSGPWAMFSQKFVHSCINYDEINNFKLHYFLNRADVPGNLEAGNFWKSCFLGGGIQSNFLNY